MTPSASCRPRRAFVKGKTSTTSRSMNSMTSVRTNKWMTAHPPAQGRGSGRIKRSRRPVLTSDGEVVAGTYRRVDVPADVLTGLPVSAGTIEGRARGHALTWPRPISKRATSWYRLHTDPSLGHACVRRDQGPGDGGGGLMTHGAVVAREYGLPAVVGVEHGHPADPGWAADPRAWNGRVHRDPALGDGS